MYKRMAHTIAEENERLLNFFAANYCLVNMLAVKHQTIFFANFTESIFHFNGYMDHKRMSHAHCSIMNLRPSVI